MFTHFRSSSLQQNFTALWQPSPVYVGMLTAGLLRYSRHTYTASKDSKVGVSNRRQQSKQDQKERRQLLVSLYRVGFAVTAVGHAFTVYTILKDPKLSITNTFLPSVKSPDQQSSSSSILNFLQWDMGLYVLSAATHGLQSILELRTQGYLTTSQSVVTALSFTLGNAVVGPAAAQIYLSMWKEKLLLGMGM